MYIDLTTDCGCGCCGLTFINNNSAEYAIQENPMNDTRVVSNIDFSLEIWVKFSSAGLSPQCVATNYNAANPNGFWALIRNGNIVEFVAGVNISSAAVFGNRIAIFSNPIQFNKWYHIVANRVTNNPVYWELYFNGQKQNNGGINLNPNFDHALNLNQQTKFGWWGFAGTNAFFSGSIAQARLYAKPLSQSEVRYNLKNGFYRPFSIEDIYFWAPFNNCVGVIADAFASNAIGGGAQIILNNFGNRITSGSGAWGADCPANDTDLQQCQSVDSCPEKPTDDIIIERCDNLLFPPYTRKNPFINFSNYNTYNLYIDCTRQLFFESGWDWYQRNATNWAFTPNNLQTFEFYLDLSNHKPQILNLTAVRYDCNEIAETIDLAHIFPTLPSAQELLNILINWLETVIFPNAQISVSGVQNAPEQYILSVSVPPQLPICDNRMIALSKPNALRPGQEVPVNPQPPAGDGIVIQRCTRLRWENSPGAMESCISEAPPPDDPPGDLCESEEDVNAPFIVDQNDLGLAVVGDCLVFPTPGVYAFQYNVEALLEQLFGWQKTVCLTGRVRILVQMQILDQVQTIYDYDYVKNNSTITQDCIGGALFWNANNNTETTTNPFSTASFGIPVTQLNVTQQHIDDGDNKICLRTLVQTAAQLTCFGCDDEPPSNCCEGTIGGPQYGSTNSLTSGWAPGVQSYLLGVGGVNPGLGQWLYAEDTLNPGSGSIASNFNRGCFGGVTGDFPCLNGDVRLQFGQIDFEAGGTYIFNYNVEYLRFVCWLWENTKCISGTAEIKLWLNVFGVKTLLDTYTVTKTNEPVPCNMPVVGGAPAGICTPVAFTPNNPPPGLVFSGSIPVTNPGSPNDVICFETEATITADYTGCNEDCGGTNNPGLVCRNMNVASGWGVGCNATATPPDVPTDTCENFINSNLKFDPQNIGTNPGGIHYNSTTGCLEIQQAGNYTIDLVNIIGIVEMAHNTNNLNNGITLHSGWIKLKIANLPHIVIVEESIGSATLPGPGITAITSQSCNDNITQIVTGATFNQTINLTVTAAMITANQNRICWEYNTAASVTSAGTYCNPAQPGAILGVTEVKLQGAFRICRDLGTALLPGKVAIQAANFLRGTFSICRETPLPPSDDRFIEAIGEVTLNGNLVLCQSRQIPNNCSFLTYNESESINCTITVPHTDPLPIAPCENDQRTPGFIVPIATTPQDTLLVNGGNCIVFSQPGSYTVDINLAYTIREIWFFNNISAYNFNFDFEPYIVIKGVVTMLPPINDWLVVNPSICGSGTPQTTNSNSYASTGNINITQTDINNGDNEICIYMGMRVRAEIDGIDCPGTFNRTLGIQMDATLTGDILVCRNPSPPPAFQTEGTNWYGAEQFANNRDRFLEDCFNVRSCFTGWVFWTNLCLRLWRDVICIKDNGTQLELPCAFDKVIDTEGPCRNLFQKMRLGYSFLDVLFDKHVAFCSQPIRLVSDCDTILIRFRNDNEIFKTVRIEGTIEKISFVKNQEVSYSSKGINRKLYSAVSREWQLETGYYTERFHVELMRALESDYFEAEINGEWYRFIFEDAYNVEWDDADPGQKRGKASVKLKSYQRDVYNDFCVFEQ